MLHIGHMYNNVQTDGGVALRVDLFESKKTKNNNINGKTNFANWPPLMYLVIFVFQEKMSICKVPGAIAASTASTYSRFNLQLVQFDVKPKCCRSTLMFEIRIPCISP